MFKRCVRWYCKYRIPYRYPAEMMQERGIEVGASTIMAWSIVMRLSWRNGFAGMRALVPDAGEVVLVYRRGCVPG
jgi:hypothetical protein